MTTYSDAYLNHFADRYVELGLRDLNITLLQYLAAPQACERAAAEFQRLGQQPDPLIMPQQISLMEAQLEADVRAARGVVDTSQTLDPDPQTREIEADAERGLEHCPRRGGRIIEPLHHHSWSHRRHPEARRKPA